MLTDAETDADRKRFKIHLKMRSVNYFNNSMIGGKSSQLGKPGLRSSHNLIEHVILMKENTKVGSHIERTNVFTACISEERS